MAGADTFIPDKIGGQDILIDDAPFVGTVEFIDGVVVFGPSVMFLLMSDALLPPIVEAYSLIFTILIALFGLSLLVIKPAYKTVSEWLKDIRQFKQRETEYDKHLETDGGRAITDYNITPDNDTRRLTGVEKVHPHKNAIQMNDGTIAGILEFSGSNLDMATGSVMNNVIQQYSSSIGSQLEHDIQFYLPMRQISMTGTKEVYTERANERDTSPFMTGYLADRVDWIEGVSQGSFVREQYVIVPVRRREIYSQSMPGKSSPLEQIGGQVLVDIKRGLLGDDTVQSKQEVVRKQFRELENRMDTIDGILSVGPGNSSRRVSSAKCIALLKEFWEGNEINDDEFDAMIREMPAVLGPNTEQYDDNEDNIQTDD